MAAPVIRVQNLAKQYHLGHRLRAYRSELAFALRSAVGWRAKLMLCASTLAFHLHNALKRPPNGRSAFRIPVRLGNAAFQVTLRPFAGDLFIFYEVLMHESYSLPAACPAPEVKTIVDCGANIGLASLFFAARFPSARIFAIEPHPENFRLLQANTAHNPRITCLQHCLGPMDRDKCFFSLDRPAWGNRANLAGNGFPVVARTLASILTELAVESVDLLKVDIEGAEQDVFRAPDFLDKVRLILIELHGDYSLAHFRADLAHAHFTVHAPGALPGARLVAALPALSLPDSAGARNSSNPLPVVE